MGWLGTLRLQKEEQGLYSWRPVRRVGISQRPRQSEEKNYAHIIYHTDSEQYQRGVLFTESGGEMSRLNVLEDIHACGGSRYSKGRGLSGIDTSQVFVMIVCMCVCLNCFLYCCLRYIAMLSGISFLVFFCFFWKEIHLFIQQICIQSTKSDIFCNNLIVFTISN